MTQRALDALTSLYDRDDLSFAQAESVFDDVMKGELDDITLSALLIALKMKGEHTNEIAGAASAMIKNARPFPQTDYPYSDIVGTGGDGHNTINVSSAAAIVAASCGIKVAKHGNRSVSSKSGSSDLFAGFGMNLMMSPEAAKRCLEQANICFLAAPNYHAGVGHAMAVRTTLKTRTLFNILGPLANPSKPSHGVYGVYTPALLDVYAQVLVTLGHENALVVHGAGLDEIGLHGTTQARHIHQGNISSIEITPECFGAKNAPITAIEGGEPEHNVALISDVLSGKGNVDHQHAIALNAAALLWVNAPQRAKQDCFAQVMDTLLSGAPLRTIEAAAQLSQQEV
ncbi:anthranilate phosphoribosyltransferase [Glaciecola sp. XM2]|jgi:anthranilate phosphoribosyltransferase|uniref:anthranilate phosphoribosyltransferase n=1 Tax=Glaciecola sp. XM2 TaxID=1914931 RepID=UPI001BDF154D|nr:anthranilate phosphoribosyltransferase [Glaciecola sp. XM2]MBT1452103.1 anthranilate phosphoribosyltransferase [Glaciecola sp. XM2]